MIHFLKEKANILINLFSNKAIFSRAPIKLGDIDCQKEYARQKAIKPGKDHAKTTGSLFR